MRMTATLLRTTAITSLVLAQLAIIQPAMAAGVSGTAVTIPAKAPPAPPPPSPAPPPPSGGGSGSSSGGGSSGGSGTGGSSSGGSSSGGSSGGVVGGGSGGLCTGSLSYCVDLVTYTINGSSSKFYAYVANIQGDLIGPLGSQSGPYSTDLVIGTGGVTSQPPAPSHATIISDIDNLANAMTSVGEACGGTLTLNDNLTVQFSSAACGAPLLAYLPGEPRRLYLPFQVQRNKLWSDGREFCRERTPFAGYR